VPQTGFSEGLLGAGLVLTALLIGISAIRRQVHY
jgi:hypothetical protein